MKRYNKKLNEMIKDERLAPKEYLKLVRLTMNKSDKNKIKHIINQERKHLKTLTKIKGGKYG